MFVRYGYEPGGNAVARIPLRGDVRYGYEPGGYAVARVPLRGDVRYGYEPGRNAVAHVPLRVLGMGMGQAGICPLSQITLRELTRKIDSPSGHS